jgi:hypothetical protein
MGTKRVAPRASGPAPSTPVFNALLLLIALSYALWLLVSRGRLSWPPTELLAGASTLAGCLALVGPIVLFRRDASESGLGDLLWMTGGILLWVFDVAGLYQGGARSISWVAPMGSRAMGLTILAVLLAGWRLRGGEMGGRPWSWTNVTGWVLGLFWVGLALASFLPSRGTGLASL